MEKKMECPVCHSEFEFVAERNGQQMQCPYCQETFDVPAGAVPEKKRSLKWLYIALGAVILVCLGVGIGLGARLLYTKAESNKPGKGSAEKKVDSPSEVLQKIITNTKEQDCDTVVKLSHGEQKKQLQRGTENIKSAKDAAKNGNKKAQRWLDERKSALKNWKIDVKAEEIDGDLAVVYGVGSGNPAGSKHNGPCAEFFEKVDGEWKWISFEDYVRKALAKYAVPKGLSPSEIVSRMVDAMKTMNPYAAANLSHGKENAEASKGALGIIKLKAAAYAGNEQAKKFLDSFKNCNVEVKGKTIDGDFAVVDVVVSGNPKGKNGPDKVYLKKVDGEWKVIKEEEYKRERSYR